MRERSRPSAAPEPRVSEEGGVRLEGGLGFDGRLSSSPSRRIDLRLGILGEFGEVSLREAPLQRDFERTEREVIAAERAVRSERSILERERDRRTAVLYVLYISPLHTVDPARVHPNGRRSAKDETGECVADDESGSAEREVESRLEHTCATDRRHANQEQATMERDRSDAILGAVVPRDRKLPRVFAFAERRVREGLQRRRNDSEERLAPAPCHDHRRTRIETNETDDVFRIDGDCSFAHRKRCRNRDGGGDERNHHRQRQKSAAV